MSEGTLYVAATPIGNLEDMSQRLRRLLAEADFVACEDTRRARILLQAVGVNPPRIRLDEHAPEANLRRCVERLQRGETGVYVSDAGTPGVSDPGPDLVQAAVRSGIPVWPVAGPAAVAVALSVSGFRCPQFGFGGFLERKLEARREQIEFWSQATWPVVFFLSPHRIREEMAALALVVTDRPVCLLREMTKMHETHYRGSAAEVAAMDLPARGEYALVVDACPVVEPAGGQVLEEWIDRLYARGLTGRALVETVVDITGAVRKAVYDQVLRKERDQ